MNANDAQHVRQQSDPSYTHKNTFLILALYNTQIDMSKANEPNWTEQPCLRQHQNSTTNEQVKFKCLTNHKFHTELHQKNK